MIVDVVIPALGESITEGTISTWHVAVGDVVTEDQPLCEVETDKVTTDLPSPRAGRIEALLVEAGADVPVGATVARIDTEGRVSTSAPISPSPLPTSSSPIPASVHSPEPPSLTPAGRQLVKEHGLDPAAVAKASAPAPRVGRGEVLTYLEQRPTPAPPPPVAPLPAVGTPGSSSRPLPSLPSRPTGMAGRSVRRVPMTRLRKRIAERLKEVQNTAAILTTFNEIDMSVVVDLRKTHGEEFQKAHGVKLGFMSFFVKASIEALKEFPALNGQIDGGDIVYNEFYDIGVAVSTDRGLVVPVIRDADRLSFAEVEKAVNQLGEAARTGSLTLEQLDGGTFSVTNGGVFGSLLSTPILNAPQSGILGMHTITRRPVAVGDKVEIRPIMFVALSYDHRIVDGAQAVRFLVKIKQILENPTRLLLEI